MTEIKTIEVDSMAEFMAAVLEAHERLDGINPWWRGHELMEWKLRPSIYRKQPRRNEVAMVADFMSGAKIRHRNVPDHDDLPGWLFLMQHYGLPTRILDWTKSPLTALFFAVRDEGQDGHHGAVWGLNPGALNVNQEESATALSPEAGSARAAIHKAFGLGDATGDDRKILAINSSHFDLRQMMQASEFTLHGKEQPVEDLEGPSDFLVRMVIPKEAKKRIRNELEILHVEESSLFPDLAHWASGIAAKDYR